MEMVGHKAESICRRSAIVDEVMLLKARPSRAKSLQAGEKRMVGWGELNRRHQDFQFGNGVSRGANLLTPFLSAQAPSPILAVPRVTVSVTVLGHPP
jgi:hypothetical protein